MIKTFYLLLSMFLLVGCSSNALENPQFIVLDDDGLLDSSNVWTANNTFVSINLLNGGLIFDNASCTFIVSPNGSNVLEVCDA